MAQVIKNFFSTLWVGFCHLALLVLVLGLMGALFFGGLWLVCAVFWVSFMALGHVGALFLWGTVLVIVVSYGLGKEFKNIGWD